MLLVSNMILEPLGHSLPNFKEAHESFYGYLERESRLVSTDLRDNEFMTELTRDQVDRAVGSVLASAVGDALGSAFEFKASHDDDWHPYFGVGTFGHGVGEWTDDTSMAIPILEWVAAHGELPRRHIIERWLEWSQDAKDVGILTRTILSRLKPTYERLESIATLEAHNVHKFNGKTAGNGALMRVGPYALKNLHKPLDGDELSAITRWTHYDEDNVKACRFWVEAIRMAILDGELDISALIDRCDLSADEVWLGYLRDAQRPGVRAKTFHENGWVVGALQAALASILTTDNLVDALEEAIRGGGDTDTVAAITGSLAGALYGAKAIPEDWRNTIHGWPDFDANLLELLVLKSVQITT